MLTDFEETLFNCSYIIFSLLNLNILYEYYIIYYGLVLV